MVAKVNTEECTGCGVCVDECSAGAITLNGEKANIEEDKCTDCGTCESSCPNEVITIV